MATYEHHLNIKSMSPLLLVADLHQSLTFYTRQLGFDIAFLYEDFYAGITNQGYSIHLKLGNPDPEERANRRKNEDLDIMFSVVGIGKLYQTLQDRPVELTQLLREMPYGREFYIADPDGYILGFVEETVLSHYDTGD